MKYLVLFSIMILFLLPSVIALKQGETTIIDVNENKYAVYFVGGNTMEDIEFELTNLVETEPLANEETILKQDEQSCYFISIIIFLFVYSELKNEILIKSLISIVIFPIIDVIYVVIYRIFKKENLLSRNYLHLYQIIAKKTNSKLYILPNILFPLLNIFISSYFSLGTFFIVFLVISNTFILIITHLILKKFI